MCFIGFQLPATFVTIQKCKGQLSLNLPKPQGAELLLLLNYLSHAPKQVIMLSLVIAEYL
jgi:hypothetical protein